MLDISNDLIHQEASVAAMDWFPKYGWVKPGQNTTSDSEPF